MTIQQFAEELTEQEDRSPLLEALRALRTFSLEQVREFDVVWSSWNPVDQPAEDPQA